MRIIQLGGSQYHFTYIFPRSSHCYTTKFQSQGLPIGSGSVHFWGYATKASANSLCSR